MAMPPSSGTKIMRTLRWPIIRKAAMWPSSCSATTVVSTAASAKPAERQPEQRPQDQGREHGEADLARRMLEQAAGAVFSGFGPDLQLAEFAPQREVAEDQERQRRDSGRCATASRGPCRLRAASSVVFAIVRPERRIERAVVDRPASQSARPRRHPPAGRCARSACRRALPSRAEAARGRARRQAASARRSRPTSRPPRRTARARSRRGRGRGDRSG